jgi:predicted nuclease of restriction endonuclease-like (RecB) superfamily
MKFNYINDIKKILENARNTTYAVANTEMIKAYWLIGRKIVEEQQQGKGRAEYGKEVIKSVSKELTESFGKGFSERTVREFRQFYMAFSDLLIIENEDENFWRTPSAISVNPIWRTPFAKLHWSHYQRVIRVKDKAVRAYYLTEAAEQNWPIRTLDRNISTLYYQRLLSSQNKEEVKQEMEAKSHLPANPKDFIRNPAVLEFLGLTASKSYTETQLEQSLIDNMQAFLLELGKGFAFVARQKHIRTETQDFYIDLVFYNYILKCFVLVELKTHKLSHQNIGQLDMYVRMFDDLERGENDNPTIGILLCTETDQTIAKYSVLSESQQLFANKYLPYLPTEEELAAEIERDKNLFMEAKVQYGG